MTMNIDEFFKQHGSQLVKLHEDDSETGNFRLFCPEECSTATHYKDNGYTLASIFEDLDGDEYVVIDNDPGDALDKIGFFILQP